MVWNHMMNVLSKTLFFKNDNDIKEVFGKEQNKKSGLIHKILIRKKSFESFIFTWNKLVFAWDIILNKSIIQSQKFEQNEQLLKRIQQ